MNRGCGSAHEVTMTASDTDERAVRNHGWSPELLTVLGAVLMIGVGLSGLILNMQGHIREDMRSLETRLREDMGVMEARLRADMELMEARLREDMREVRSDVGKLRERVSRLEGRLHPNAAPATRPDGMPPPTSPS